jgi:ribosomal-protein-alanine N-acetyltransferase
MPIHAIPAFDSARLQLRKIVRADLDTQFALFSDLRLRQFGRKEAWTSLGEAQAWMDGALANYANGSSLVFAVTLKGSEEVIANVRLFNFDDDCRMCEIGYIMAYDHHGHGYVQEAVGAVLDFAFTELNMNRIEASADPRNAASLRVLERVGFAREGLRTENWMVGGELCDSVMFGLLRRHWRERAL